MAEGATIINNPSVDYGKNLRIPQNLVYAELDGLYGSTILRDMHQIIQLYDVYDKGADYITEAKDYTPADLKFKYARAILDKEARFLFSRTPDFYVDVDPGDTKAQKEAARAASVIYQTLVDNVLRANQFPKALLQAAKDCFIGKRVALMYNINEKTGKIGISFLPSLEFVYDVDPGDSNRRTKIIACYGLNNETSHTKQRIYKKKYELKDNGFCYYTEEIYDGLGQVVQVISPETQTKFDFIPAWVIINDGLTGDLIGTSEIELLQSYESWYSKMSGKDLDAENTGMNPIRWARDMSPESTKGLSISAGAFGDLSTDQNAADGVTGEVGVLDSPMSYTPALSTTLDRIKNAMYDQTAVPNVSPEALKGVVSSGKTLKAIYWDLIVRCDEKMLVWRPALQFMAECIIEGARLYPGVLKTYIEDSLPDEPYEIRVDNQYSLPEDEAEEKQIDLSEVNAQTMSKKSYMKKWRNLTDEEADEELQQIARERELLESSYFNPGDIGTQTEDENVEEEENTQEERTVEEETEEELTEE